MNAWRESTRPGERLDAHDLEPDHGLVPDDPPVMSGRDLVDVSRAKLHLCAIVHTNTEPAGDQMTHVMRLAAVRAGERFDVLRPPPPRLELTAGDGEIAKPHDVERPMGKGPRLVRSAHVLSLQRCHDLLLALCLGSPMPFAHEGIFSIATSSHRTSPSRCSAMRRNQASCSGSSAMRW